MSRSPSKLLRRRCKSSKCARCSHLNPWSSVNKELSGQLSTIRSPVVMVVVVHAMRAPARLERPVACVNDKRGAEVHRCSSGNSQGRPWESETPCQRSHYYAVGLNDHLSTARNGGGGYQSPTTTGNKAEGRGWGGVGWGWVGWGVFSAWRRWHHDRSRTFFFRFLTQWFGLFFLLWILAMTTSCSSLR